MKSCHLEPPGIRFSALTSPLMIQSPEKYRTAMSFGCYPILSRDEGGPYNLLKQCRLSFGFSPAHIVRLYCKASGNVGLPLHFLPCRRGIFCSRPIRLGRGVI